MDDLKVIRNQIDAIDQELFQLLNRRFSYAKDVKKIKQKHNLNILDASREEAILSSIPACEYQDQIKEVYLGIFKASKALQKESSKS